MLESILYMFHGFIILLFGALLSIVFAGIRGGRKELFVLLSTCILSAAAQLVCTQTLSEQYVWMLYPLITHLPLILVFYFVFHKHITTTFVAIFTSYLCCQPAKWLGVLVLYLTENVVWEYVARIIALILVAYVCLFHLADRLSQIYNSPPRTVSIFCIVPAAYYVFDYIAAVYTDFWETNNPVATEFLPLLLVIAYMVFCTVYFEAFDKKSDAERREQIIRITVQQQAKKIEAAEMAEKDIRLLRHDMRHLLNMLAAAVENGNIEDAKQMIASYSANLEPHNLEQFCQNSILNYVLSDFSSKCQAKNVPFTHVVQIQELKQDVMLVASILSNGLDNAFNAQAVIDPEKRYIKLLIKHSEGKLLLSVKNPVEKAPVFVSGLPVTNQKGHGYGTQSIRYLAERMGGNCQFSVQDGVFVLRVVL